MKTNLLNISILVLLTAVSLCGCSNDDEAVATTTDGTTLTVTVRADGFAPTDGTAQTDTPQTRASESGYATTFVEGDRIGVFAVKNGSVMADCKNLPCTYDGTSWSSSTPIYKYADATYFAYYPYTESMNDKTSVDAIVSAFNTTVTAITDQSTYANYTACDLMTTDDAVSPSGGTSLSFTFTHRMSLIEISLPVQKYTTSSGADAYEYSAPVLGATFSLVPGSGNGATTIKPCPMGNDIYRYIVPAGTSGATLSGVFHTADGKTIEYSKSSLSLSAGNYKRLNVTYDGAPSTPTVRALAVGDFYYSDGSICPGNVSNPPSEGCIGVVYWVGSIIEEDPLLKEDHPGCTHGLVAALQDAGKTLWSSDYEDITERWLQSQGNTYGITNLKEENKMQGYANTKALEGYNASESATGNNSGKTVLPIGLILSYAGAHQAPESSSGWYFPSIKELKFMCWGQNASGGSEGKKKLNGQFGKITGASPLPYYCWSSTEINLKEAWYVYFGNGYFGNDRKHKRPYWVRAVLAF